MTSNAWKDRTLGIVGGGNMAEALVRGVLSARLMAPGAITVNDILPERRRVFAELGCRAVDRLPDALRADVALLAVKPQQMAAALDAMRGDLRPGTLVVSIAAGVPVRMLEERLPAGVGVVRVMPNTPLLVGQGVSALAGGRGVGAEEMRLALELFSCAGMAVAVDESKLDAVTALSGSGPAYLFRFAEALIDGGVDLGLPPELAKEMVIGLLKGSSAMLGFGEPADLRRRVTSPGGTTEAALSVLERRDFAGTVREAMAAACRRSAELGRGE